MGHTPAAPAGCTIEAFHFKGQIIDVFYSSSARESGNCLHGTVVMVKVIEGKITTTEEVAVKVSARTLRDRVVRIEREYQPVNLAKEGDDVGICLANLKVGEIMALGGAEWTCRECGSLNEATARKCINCPELAPI